MKSYPSIPTIKTINTKNHQIDLSKNNWYGFEKLDGSLIRAEWKEGSGFKKFGSRRQLLDDSNPVLLEAPDIIKTEFRFLLDIFKEFKWKRGIVYFEFYGYSSFAGNHKKEKHYLKLIDLSIYPKGFVDVKELALMEAAGGAKVLYSGLVTQQILDDIHNRRLKGMPLEGVVFKRTDHKGNRQMFKTKSQAWYNRLRDKCGDNDAMFGRLC